MTAVLTSHEEDVLDELVFQFGRDFTREQLRICLKDATRQLAGSIASESLPEMAVRLVSYRLRRER